MAFFFDHFLQATNLTFEAAQAVLHDPALLEEPEMRRIAEMPVGVQRG